MEHVIRDRISLGTIFRTSDNWNRFLAFKGKVRRAILTHVTKFLLCRTPALGIHLVECTDPNCGARRVIPHSCKSQACPSCGKVRTDQWCRILLSEMLNSTYRHLVFTLPWQLRLPLQDNWKRGMDILLKAAGRTLVSLLRGTPRPLSRKGQKWFDGMNKRKPFHSGIIVGLHSNGDDLKLNPHIHVVITCGGVSLDGKRWIRGPKKYLIPAPVLATEWKLRVLNLIQESHAQEPWYCRPLRSDPKRRIDMALLLGTIRKRRWKIRIGASLAEADPAVRYACRYTKRPVLGERRILNFKNGYVTYLYKDYHQGGKRRPKSLPVLTFIDRLTQHLPERYFHKVRYYGLFAGYHRTRGLVAARQILAQRKRRRGKALTWAQRRQAAGDKKPLSCPRCGRTETTRYGLFGAAEVVGRFVGVGAQEIIPPKTILYPPKPIPPQLRVS